MAAGGLTEYQRGLETAWRALWSGAGQMVTSLPVDCVSSEMTKCVSLSTGLSLELPIPEQESMELGHRAGRTG